MLKIALDLDGVVFDSENLYRVYTEIYDVDNFHNDNIINNKERTFQARYSWLDEEKQIFYENYSKKIIKNSNIMPGADIVINKLKKNYEFIVVTARSFKEVKIALKQFPYLKKLKIVYNTKEKLPILLNEGVTHIIDDDYKTCLLASEKGIKALYFKNNVADYIVETNNFVTVHNWGEIYKYLKLKEGKKCV